MPAPGDKKKLSSWAIVFRLVVGSLLIAFVGIGAVTYFAWSKRDAIVDFGKEAFKEADAYGAGHTQQECVEEVFRDYAHCGSFKCELRHGIFVERCMKVAKPSPEFCAEVPDPASLFAVTAWAMKECNRRGYLGSAQSCSRMLQSVTRGCHPLTTRPHQ